MGDLLPARKTERPGQKIFCTSSNQGLRKTIKQFLFALFNGPLTNNFYHFTNNFLSLFSIIKKKILSQIFNRFTQTPSPPGWPESTK